MAEGAQARDRGTPNRGGPPVMRRTAATMLALGLALGACAPATAGPTAITPASLLPPGPTSPSRSGPTSSPGSANPRRSIAAAVLGLHLPSPLSRAVAFSAGGAILVCGGLEANGSTSSAILRIDPGAGTVARVGTLAVAVHDAAGAALPTGDLVFGGGAATALATIQRCDPSGAQVVGSLPSLRADLSAVVVPGFGAIVLGGGVNASLPRAVLSTADGVSFGTVADLVDGVRYPAAVAVGRTVLVVGGYRAGTDVTDIQAVDLASGTSRVIGHLPIPLAHACAFVLGSSIVVAGGQRNGAPQAAIWQIDPSTGHVSEIGTLPGPRSDAAVVVVAGVAYLIGGEDASGQLDTIVSLAAS